jgi:hypothetical protein
VIAVVCDWLRRRWAAQDKETHHRVIVGRDYYEPQGIQPQVRLQPSPGLNS